MFKKTVLAVFLASHYLLSSPLWASEVQPNTKSYSEAELTQLKNDWLKIYQKELQIAEQLRAKQRENFTQLSQLVNGAIAQNNLSPATEQLIQRLLGTLSSYPLEIDAEWALLNAKIKLKQAKESDIQAFLAKYPNSTYQKSLQQLVFEPLYSTQKFAELVEYAKTVKPVSLAEQCRVLSARYELAANQAQINPEAGQPAQTVNTALTDLVKEFDRFWLANATLTSDCANLEAYWRDQGLKTDEKVRLKAVELVKQNANAEMANLALNTTNEDLKTWLNTVANLANNPKDLQNFVENQPLESPFKAENKALMLHIFPQYLKTLAESSDNPSFEPYQAWAEKYQLSADEINAWKVSFISRFFDNTEPTFQLWRDDQIKTLKADNLTERRLRLAISQKADLNEWLELLSPEGKDKAEWRYWAAKGEKNEANRKASLAKLAAERGFYPLLAAQALNVPYELSLPTVRDLNEEEKQRYQLPLERIKELRELGRLGQAKLVWVALIKELSQDTAKPTDGQLALIKYAKEQNWVDLAVEGTIQTKAFDNIDLRLPDAYSQWFELNLKDKTISKSFAQAIARQESAWNAQAKSSANAMGLMQMLPSTAQKTAKDNGLVFRNENDLFKPFNNIMLGTTHLAELNAKYPNNRILIAAAYNAGAARVEQWLARSDKKLAMDEFIATIPFYETRGYVQNVLAYDYYYQKLYAKNAEKATKPENALNMFTQTELTQKY